MDNMATPLWLEIKTEYIDANLDNVITYLSKGKTTLEADAFYNETLKLLEKRVREMVDSLSMAPIDEDPGSKQAEYEKALKILGSFLLIKGSSPEALIKEAFFFFIKTLTQLASQLFTEELVEVAVKCLTYKEILSYGFDWGNIRDVQPDIIAHRITKGIVFSDRFCPDTWYQNKGSLRINDGIIALHSSNKDAALYSSQAPSLQLLEKTLMTMSRPSDRIREKEANNIGVMDAFTNGFISEQATTSPSPEKSLKVYEQGSIMPVRYLGRDHTRALMVESVEGDHQRIRGTIPIEEKVFYYYNLEHFAKVLREGDIFDAKLLNVTKKTFSIADTFTKSLLNTVETGCEINAVLKQVKKGIMTWWTEDGYPAYVRENDCKDDFSIGETAVLLITRKVDNGYVHAQVVEASEEQVDEEESRSYCIEGMLYSETAKLSQPPTKNELSETSVKGLCRLLFTYQRSIAQTSERFSILCNCRILATLANDQVAKDYVEVSYAYLKNLIHFANGHIENIKTLAIPEVLSDVPAIKRRKLIVDVLKTYGIDSASDYLSEIIHGDNADAVVVQLAKLIQSCNRIDDIYPAIKNVIKQEITKYLAIQTEGNADFEETSGPNLGIENIRQEFKTSFLIAPGNAPQQNQEKTIFRSLCSFLNTTEGGVLYLGVNDSGGLIGLQYELEQLERKTGGFYSGIDGYVRYITDRAKEYFDLDVRLCFRIEPAFDGKVVAIHVAPYRYGVVSFEDIPYIRNNSESVKMSLTLKRQVETKRLQQMKDSSSLVVALNEAINEEKRVILHNYASSNKQEVRNRNVEPYAFLSGNSYIWCYDIDDHKNKLFRISRIGNVQVTQERWEMKAQHKKGQCDIFHLTGDKEIRVKLQLDQMAKNLLVEEYPDAKNEIRACPDDTWILETICRQIYGIGRYYVGLVNHIRILDAPELERYATQYFKDALKAGECV